MKIDRESMKKTTLGFTIIEILVVAGILGLLSSLGLNSFFTAQKQSRDTQRKSDIAQYQTALENYANSHNGNYPRSAAVPIDTLCTYLGLTNCPKDPVLASSYYYSTGASVSDGAAKAAQYAIWGSLETQTGNWMGCSGGQVGVSGTGAGTSPSTVCTIGATPRPTATATATATPTPTPSVILLTKSGDTSATQGYVTTFTVIAKNNGNQTLNNVTITDPLTGGSSVPATLAPGESDPILFNYTVPKSQVTAIVNTANVVGYPQSGSPSSVSSSASWTISCVYPGSPSVLSVSAGAGKATLSWASITGATSYNIYKSTNSSPLWAPPFPKYATSTTNSYVDNNAPVNQTAAYYVTAVNSRMCNGGEGPQSNVALIYLR